MATDVLRDERGRMLKPLPGAAPPITSDNARAMVAKRVEKYRRAMVERILGEAQSIDPSIKTPADAYALLAVKQYQALLDSEKPVVEQLDKFGKMMTGDNGGNSQRPHESAAPSGQITASAETLLQLAHEIEAYAQAEREKARAIDAESR